MNRIDEDYLDYCSITVNFYNYNPPVDRFTAWYNTNEPITLKDIFTFVKETLINLGKHIELRIPEECYVYISKVNACNTRCTRIRSPYNTVVDAGTTVTILTCHPCFNHRWGIIYKKGDAEKTVMFHSKEEMIYEFNNITKNQPPDIREIIGGQFDILSVPSTHIQIYDVWINNNVTLDECRTRIESRIICRPHSCILRRSRQLSTHTDDRKRESNHTNHHQNNSKIPIPLASKNISSHDVDN